VDFNMGIPQHNQVSTIRMALPCCMRRRGERQAEGVSQLFPTGQNASITTGGDEIGALTL
jgi:hypothetical protein